MSLGSESLQRSLEGLPAGDGAVVGLDVGATYTSGCLVWPNGTYSNHTVVATPPGDRAAVEDVAFKLVRSLVDANETVAVIGIAVAGWVDKSRRTILFSAHLPWKSEPLAANLSARLGLPVVMENDANAATWAERQFGAGQNFEDFLLVTVGSGIGAGIVLDGQLIRGAHGLAGELGHAVVDPDGPACPCGRQGCIDSLASGRALQRRFGELRDAADGAGPAADSDAVIPGSEIAAAAERGDPAALQAFADVGEALGTGLADLVMCLDPEAVILAGGVASSGELLRAPTQAALRRSLSSRDQFTQIQVLTSSLGREAGSLGVAHLARIHAASLRG